MGIDPAKRRRGSGLVLIIHGYRYLGNVQNTCIWVLIRYHFDYESAQIWRSAVLETSRYDPSVRRPSQVFDGTTWAGSIPRHVAPAQAEAGANSCEAVRSCRTPETRPRAVSSGWDPYSNSRFCAPEVPRH